MKIRNRKIVSALIFSRDGKLFMGRKDTEKGGVYLDCWHIPGGGIDPGESKEQALIREIHEEIGLDISHEKFILIDDQGTGSNLITLKNTREKIKINMSFSVYQIKLHQAAEQIKITLSDQEWNTYRWFEKSELATVKITPPSVRLFKKLGLIE